MVHRLAQGPVVEFEAGGALISDDFEAQYQFCYNYTILAWNQNSFEMRSNRELNNNIFTHANHGKNTVSSLNVMRNYRESLDMIQPGSTVMVLPNGSAMAWESPHQLLQSAYALGLASPIIEGRRVYSPAQTQAIDIEGISLVNSGAVSWDSQYLFKPNNKQQDVYGAELVSILASPHIEVISPPFTLEPDNNGEQCQNWETGCSDIDQSGPQSYEIIVNNLNFDMAVPVLSGWSLGYKNDDHTITDLGIRISSFSYSPPSDESTGVLRYQVEAVADNGEDYHARYRHHIRVLGFASGVLAPNSDVVGKPSSNAQVLSQ